MTPPTEPQAEEDRTKPELSDLEVDDEPRGGCSDWVPVMQDNTGSS